MRRTLYVTASIWIMSALLALPDVVTSSVNTSRPHMPFCDAYLDAWGADWYRWHMTFRTIFRFVVLFACPLVVITLFYSAIAITLLCRSRDAGASGDAAARQLDSRRKVQVIHSGVHYVTYRHGRTGPPGLPGGPVGPASRWATTSNVEVGQTTYPV